MLVKCVSLLLSFILLFLLSSCYAFLQADKLIYAGTVAKKPQQIEAVDDSIYINK